jgi:membrane-associated phospholipid phosphatase
MAVDAVLDWNAVALEALKNDASMSPPDQGGPTRGANAMAIAHIAMYDAVAMLDGSHESYLFHGNTLEGVSLDAAVAAAAHGTLVRSFPKQVAELDAALEAYLAEIPDGPGEDQGFALGEATARRILLDRADDGSLAPQPYEFNPDPGHHQVDPLHPLQGVLTPKWGQVKPFSMETGFQYRVAPPPALTSEEYAAAFEEVRLLGAVDAETADRDGNGQPDRTPEQTEIGLFWAYDGAKGLGTPPRLFNQIARVIAQQEGNTIADNARLFALLNIAMADAGIAAWETKYEYDFWRPVVAIRAGDADGNPDTVGDADWAPLGAPASNSDDPDGDFTPPFPAYTSGHATFGAAAFGIIERFYGADEIAFEFQSDELNGVTKDARGVVRPATTRQFDRLSEATWENAFSRIYLGVHWQFDATMGIEQGTAIAEHVFEHEMQLLAQSQPDPVLDWNTIALDAVMNDHSLASPDQGGPTKSALALGVIHTAIFDAVNAIDGSYVRYAFNGKGARSASIDAAVAAAAHLTLVDHFPQQKAVFDAALAARLAAVPDGPAKDQGMTIGRLAANRLLGMRENDGRDLDMSHELIDAPGHHQPDPMHPDQGFLTPKWGKIQPFAMNDGAQFRVAAPPPLDSPEYAAAYEQVRVIGAVDAETSDRDGNGLPDRTPEQTEIGLFWAYDGTRGLGTPPRLYNQIAQAIAKQQGNSVIDNARMFALLNIAMADAGIASWETKYEYDLWRPVVAIRKGDVDGNDATVGDPEWRPLGAPGSNSDDPHGDFTPPFPAYVSGHATFGAAAFRTLERFYGADDVSFDFMSNELDAVTRSAAGETRHAIYRHFDSFSDAAWENAFSRIYLGIHWSFDATEGIAQGTQVADYVFDHKLRARQAFQNEQHELDVDGDGSLTIADLLAQVQQMRHIREHGTMNPELAVFCDVNDDTDFTLGDVLLVVQGMRAQREAERTPPTKEFPSGGSNEEGEAESGDSILYVVTPSRLEQQEENVRVAAPPQSPLAPRPAPMIDHAATDLVWQSFDSGNRTIGGFDPNTENDEHPLNSEGLDRLP